VSELPIIILISFMLAQRPGSYRFLYRETRPGRRTGGEQGQMTSGAGTVAVITMRESAPHSRHGCNKGEVHARRMGRTGAATRSRQGWRWGMNGQRRAVAWRPPDSDVRSAGDFRGRGGSHARSPFWRGFRHARDPHTINDFPTDLREHRATRTQSDRAAGRGRWPCNTSADSRSAPRPRPGLNYSPANGHVDS
jgi:hypothetical protein